MPLLISDQWQPWPYLTVSKISHL